MILESLNNTQLAIEKTLNQAGLINGIYLTREEIEKNEKIMYWRDFVVVKEGSEKDTYVVWHIDEMIPAVSGDGTVLYTTFKVSLFIRTKQYKHLQELALIEKSCKDNNIDFSFSSNLYDSDLRSHNYVFTLSGLV